jgi:hypothetical protein
LGGQHYNRAFYTLLAHEPTQLAAIGIWQTHIKDNQLVKALFGLHHRAGTIVSFEHVEVFGHKQLLAQGLAQIVVVVDKKNSFELSHDGLLCY